MKNNPWTDLKLRYSDLLAQYKFPLRVITNKVLEAEKPLDPGCPKFAGKPNLLTIEDNSIFDSNWKEFLGCSEWLRCDLVELQLIVDTLNLLEREEDE